MAALEQSASPSRKRTYTQHSDDMRACVVHLRARGDSWWQVIAATGMPLSTARSIVQTARDEERTHKRHKGGNHTPVISDAVKRLIADLQSADHTLRLQDIHDALDVTLLDTPPSLKTIWRVLHAAGFTTKAHSRHAAPRNTLATKESRRTWCIKTAPRLHADTVIFIDESPFTFCITRTRGRSRKGTPAITTTPQIRGKNHTVIAAISPTRGLLYHAVHVTQPNEEFISRRKGSKKRKTGPKGLTRDVFCSFLIDLLARPPLSDRSTTFALVLDNAAIHKGDIEETIFQVGHTCTFLPAWSPALNPIEYTFSKWKLAYRVHHADSEAAVDVAIKQAASSITPQDCMHWFEHTQSLYAKCRHGGSLIIQ
jgi:hypothetical protein